MQQNLKWLTDRLPPVELIWRRSEPDFYGASYIIARQIGRTSPPVSFATWRHGWYFSKFPIHPRELAMGSKKTLKLMGTKLQAQLLKEFGYKRVVAVGLPYIYADTFEVPRRAGSLLVMPAHSLPYTEQRWDQDAYVSEIANLKEEFSTVVACIHRSCVAHGYWTKQFERHGIPWIQGADSFDRHALIRANTLFKSFEYMTTNSMGSHVAYAAYSGARVSIFGPYAAPVEEDLKNDPFYKNSPALLALRVESLQEKYARFFYPELFFEDPRKATIKTEWGARMLGVENKRSPFEIARLLGWTPIQQLAGYCREGMRLAIHPSALRGLINRRQMASEPPMAVPTSAGDKEQ